MKGLRERLQVQAAASQLEQAEPELLRDYYQSVLDSVGSVVYTVNRDLRITGANQAWDDFARACGAEHLARPSILGTHLLDQMHGEPLARWRDLCLQLLKGELPRYLDEVASHQRFEWRHFTLSASPLRNRLGEITGITFVATNITQLKKAEYEMYQRLVQIRGLQQVTQTAGSWADRRRVYRDVTTAIAQLFSAAKCVIFLWDEKTGNLQAQEPAHGLAGRKLAELELDMGHPGDPDSLWPDLEQKDYILLNEGDPAPADMVETSARVDRLAAMLGILRVSGRVHGAILVAGRARPFSNQDGQLLALFAVPTALSIENSELNRRLLDRTQQLVRAQDELDRLVKLQQQGRVPLGMVRGYLELLLDGAMGPLTERQHATLQMVLGKTRDLIRQIGGTFPLRIPNDAKRLEKVYVGDVVRGVLEGRRAAMKRAGVQLSARLPPLHDEGATTMGDPDMLFPVFGILLDNAFKRSMPDGAVRVTLDVTDGTIHVKVADSGSLIPTDRLASIWSAAQPSQQAAPVDLAEVKRIVEGHSGQVWAESAPSEGTAFHVVLRQVRPSS